MDIFIGCQDHQSLLGRIDKIFRVTVIYAAAAFDFNKNDKITFKSNKIDLRFTERPVFVKDLKARFFKVFFSQKLPEPAEFIV